MFGEYGIIKGSRGFAFPFNKYFGELIHAPDISHVEQSLRLNDFCNYLKNSNVLSKELNTSKFETDISSGLFFKSDIPYGYGVGSSGALCAAVYAKYSNNFIRKESYGVDELDYLQDMMALMESYYHGTSSGLDCLISLIDKPVIIKSRNNLEVVTKPDFNEFGGFYLLESGLTRKTSPLVHDFLTKFDNNKSFRSEIEDFISITDEIISNLFSPDKESFKKNFILLSKLQYVNFSNMIPEPIKKIWMEGLESKEFFLKLCGAGGGGYFLLYSPNNVKLENMNLIKLS
jgi:mevalonate kinase